MREITIKLYQYDELTDAAKQKAVEWFLTDYPNYNWHENILDYIDRIAKCLGIQISRRPGSQEPLILFDLHSGVLSYDAYYIYSKDWQQSCHKEFGSDCFTGDDKLSTFLRAWKQEVIALQKPAFYGLEFISRAMPICILK